MWKVRNYDTLIHSKTYGPVKEAVIYYYPDETETSVTVKALQYGVGVDATRKRNPNILPNLDHFHLLHVDEEREVEEDGSTKTLPCKYHTHVLSVKHSNIFVAAVQAFKNVVSSSEKQAQCG